MKNSISGTVSGANTSYVEWSVIIAGAILASALSLILVQFGSAIGLATGFPLHGRPENSTGVIVTIGLWIVIVQVVSAIAGGYLAGRMRMPIENSLAHESEVRDGAHGLLVWATSTLIALVALSIGVAIAALTKDADTAQAITDPHMTADMTRKVKVIFAFVSIASAIISAVAAWAAATLGGDHRDNGVDHSRHTSFRRNRVTTPVLTSSTTAKRK